MAWMKAVFGIAVLACVACVAASGCRADRLAVVAPAALAGEVVQDAGRSWNMDGLAYRAMASDGKLVLLLTNQNAGLIAIGPASALVDAGGARRAIAATALSPGEQTKLILPPPPRGERVRVDVNREAAVGGFDQGGIYPGRHGSESLGRTGPNFAWPRGSSVHVVLEFVLEGKPVRHSFSFRRD